MCLCAVSALGGELRTDAGGLCVWPDAILGHGESKGGPARTEGTLSSSGRSATVCDGAGTWSDRVGVNGGGQAAPARVRCKQGPSRKERRCNGTSGQGDCWEMNVRGWEGGRRR